MSRNLKIFYILPLCLHRQYMMNIALNDIEFINEMPEACLTSERSSPRLLEDPKFKIFVVKSEGD